MVKVTSNQDVDDLLKKYDLEQFECNKKQLLKINNLKTAQNPKAGSLCKLPVWVVEYNGKSIRSTLGLDDWKIAKRIETYNKNAQKNGLRDDNFIVTKQLWVPYHELECGVTEEDPEPDEKPLPKPKPPSVVTGGVNTADETTQNPDREFSIFGSKYAKTPLTDRRLKGRIFYLISGHGGPDSGAQGKRAGHTLCEDEYAYDVTLRLLRLLLSHGATAYMIVRDPNDGIRDENYLSCDKDEVVWGNIAIPLDQKERLTQRTDIVNIISEKHEKAGRTDQTVIEIHVDSRGKNDKTDVFFYYRPGSEVSKSLALRFHRTFEQKYQRLRGARRYTGTVTSRHLHTLKETSTNRAVYIELANIQNDWDQQRIVLKNNRQAVANWLCQGLLGERK